MLRTTLLWILLPGAIFGVPANATEDLATACIACHRDSGPAGAQLPRIEGQQKEYLAREIGRFRDAHREGFPMRSVAAALTRDQVQTLATDLSRRPWSPAPQRIDAAAKDGQPLASALACSSCHGPSYRGGGLVPRLAGQNPEYLARQLRAFDSGHRELSLPAAAVSMKGLTAVETNALANFLAGLDGRVDLAWLAGSWCSESPTRRSEEWWTDARGGQMLGMHRDVSGDGPASFQFQRIAIDDGSAVYLAQPADHQPVAFPLVEAGAGYAVFANPAHDYPRRLRYQRSDRALTATFDDGVGGEVLKFEWTLDCR